MSSQKDHEFMDNLEKCFNVVQQSSAKGGIRAIDISQKLGWHKTTVYTYLNSLQYRGRIESQQGLWRSKSGEQTIQPLEKEIIIQLPMPKDKWADAARLEVHAKFLEDSGFIEVANMERILLEKYDETRTLRIKGKNVDDLNLERLVNLIQQANEKSYKLNLRGFLKKVKKSALKPENSKKEQS